MSSAIRGVIVDEQNKPLAGVQVKCGDATVTINAVDQDANKMSTNTKQVTTGNYIGYLVGTFTSTVKSDSTGTGAPAPLTGSFRMRITE